MRNTSAGAFGLLGAVALALVSTAASAAVAETTLHVFSAAEGTPATSGPAVAIGRYGNYYGALTGGSSGNGAIYRLTRGGRFTLVHVFSGGADGGLPNALARGLDGSLYGTTQNGGAYGMGTAFRIDEGGIFRTIHDFQDVDGQVPDSALVRGSDGDFYGTTFAGGMKQGTATADNCILDGFDPQYAGCGVVFRLSPFGRVTVLHRFYSDADDGAWLASGVTRGRDGWLYGATRANSIDGGGVVYRVKFDGSGFQLAGLFGSSESLDWVAPPIEGTDGNMYGVAAFGTYYSGDVYRIAPDNDFTVPYVVGGSTQALYTGLVQNRITGTFYGVTDPQRSGNGCIDSLTLDGAFNVEYCFTGGPDGSAPYATPVAANWRYTSFVGTTTAGANGHGTVYRLDLQ